MPYGVARRNHEARRAAAAKLAEKLPAETAAEVAKRLPGWVAKLVIEQWSSDRGDRSEATKEGPR